MADGGHRDGPPDMLLSLWLLLALVGLTLLATGVAVWVEVRRHRRRKARTIGRIRAWAARTASVVLVLALVAVTVADKENRDYRYIPSFAALLGSPSPDYQDGGLGVVGRYLQHPASAPTTHGVDVEVTVPGARSHLRRVAYAYLPAAYFQPRYRHHRFPVLYLIHGSPGVAVDWIRGGQVDQTMDHLIAARRVEPFIVVMPDANGGYFRDLECQDVVGGPQDQTYLADDVVSWVDAHLRTQPDRLHRAIGGLSTGGYCGVNLMFRHQETFSAAVSHSGSGRPDHGRYTGDLWGTHLAVARQNTPDDYLPTIPLVSPSAVYLDAGASDGWARHQYRSLHPLLLARGIPTTFHVFDGERHSFDAWRRNASVSLAWLSHWFTTHQASTVTDHEPEPSATYLPPLHGRYVRHAHGSHHPGRQHHSRKADAARGADAARAGIHAAPGGSTRVATAATADPAPPSASPPSTVP